MYGQLRRHCVVAALACPQALHHDAAHLCGQRRARIAICCLDEGGGLCEIASVGIMYRTGHVLGAKGDSVLVLAEQYLAAKVATVRFG